MMQMFNWTSCGAFVIVGRLKGECEKEMRAMETGKEGGRGTGGGRGNESIKAPRYSFSLKDL